MQVLKKIEQMQLMRLPQDKFKDTLQKLIKEQGLDLNGQLDEISHFILRLPYCQSEELRRWFLQHESALFQHRVRVMDPKHLPRAVRSYCQVKPITKEEKEEHQEALLKLCSPGEFASSRFYAVPFTQVLDLVAQRQCYLHKGQAYIPQARVESLLVAKFRLELSKTLASMVAAKVLTDSQDPEMSRLVPMVRNFSKCLVTQEPGAADVALSGTSLTAANVTQHVPFMPLCMRQLQAGLQKDKKLKHWGRLQYGLFLKVGTIILLLFAECCVQLIILFYLHETTGRWVADGRCTAILSASIFEHDGRAVHEGVRLQHSTHVRSRGKTSYLYALQLQSNHWG